MVTKKVFKVSGIITRKKLVQKRKKEGIDVFKKIEIPFNVEVIATSKKDALEKIYSNFGGLYRVKRHQIKIFEVREVSLEEVKDEQIKKMFIVLNEGR